MKIILVNGGPHKDGCTNRALEEMQKIFTQQGVESEIFWLGNKPIGGCIACGGCLQTKRCVFSDKVNEFLQIAENADAFVFGSPVHYAGISGALKSFMDRAFYGKHSIFRLKPACGIVSARRSGTTSAVDEINKYFNIAEMPIVSSVYWNAVHGRGKEDVELDLEGLQTVRVLAKNLVWLTKSIKIANLDKPEIETPTKTNFIR